jgi:hypothetical protein
VPKPKSMRARRSAALVGTCVVLAAALSYLLTQLGQASPLPTLDELNCKGSYRSLGQVDYAETVRTHDTPTSIIENYVNSPEGSSKRLTPNQAGNVRYDHRLQSVATHAIAALDTSLGSPGIVIAFYRADNGDWRIDSIAECAT